MMKGEIPYKGLTPSAAAERAQQGSKYFLCQLINLFYLLKATQLHNEQKRRKSIYLYKMA